MRLSGFLPLLSLRDESRELAARMLATNLRDLNVAAWTRDTGADLRRVLLRSIEDHLERRLLTPRLLDSL